MLRKLHIGILLLLAVNTLAMPRYPESQKVRKPAVAGSFYPASAREIKSMLGPWIHPSGDKAGIGWDGWKEADLYTYQTEVVNESEL